VGEGYNWGQNVPGRRPGGSLLEMNIVQEMSSECPAEEI
jgi:hypothetical protein